MKPCSNNRKLIAWLALDALDVRQERSLRAHLEICEGCRRYLEAVSDVTAKLAGAEIRSDIQTSESFHQKVAVALRAEESCSAWEALVTWGRPFQSFMGSIHGFFTAHWVHEPGRDAFHRVPIFIRKIRDGVEFVLTRFMERLALPIIAAVLVVIAALSLFLRRPGVSVPAPTAAQTVLTPNAKSDLDPTIANYAMAANRSLEKLDELLTRQGNRNPSPAPIYTASSLARADTSD